MRVSWLGDVLRNEGLTVIEYGEPRGRGREMSSVKGVVLHDTVTYTNWSDEKVAALLRDGRTGLPGPLAQLGLDRQGRFWWIADGRSNHNGFGTWSNNSIGIETFANGGGDPREPWNDKQRASACTAAAAILRRLSLDESCCQGHKEQDPRRKQDPFAVDMRAIRAAVHDKLQGKTEASQPSPPAPGKEETMEYGQQNIDVAQVQHLLNRFVYLTGGGLDGGGQEHDRNGRYLKVDGHYGDYTRLFVHHALRRAQEWVLGFPIYQDGVARPPGDRLSAQSQAFLATATNNVLRDGELAERVRDLVRRELREVEEEAKKAEAGELEPSG